MSLKELVRSPALPTQSSGTLRKMLNPSMTSSLDVVLEMVAKVECRAQGVI
jgi:hypothetical protein